MGSPVDSCQPPQSDCIVTFTDAGPCPVGSGCPVGLPQVVGQGTKNLWPGRTGNGYVNGNTLSFMFNNNVNMTATISDNKLTWQNGVVWTKVSSKPPAPKPTPTSIPSSETLESCKQKCIEHQADGCKGIVYDALDKKCWFKNFFAGEGEAKANRQAFILNPGCSKPNVPVPPKKPDCCKGWQQTLNCSGSGPPDTRSSFLLSSTHGSHGCKVNVPSGASGYCTCRDGKKLLFDCGHSGFTCEEKCANNCGPPPAKPVHVLPPSKTKAECKKKPLPQPPKPAPAPPSGKCIPNVPALAALGNPVIDGIASNGCKNYTTKAACGPIGTMCPACCVWQGS